MNAYRAQQVLTVSMRYTYFTSYIPYRIVVSGLMVSVFARFISQNLWSWSIYCRE